ncbi:MAG: hypothetical protein IJW79_05755, partial [Clostridia bacterium]|nr:hypothetical protein [Clostridia bacterium]
MKKRFLVLVLALVMLVQCGCAVAPVAENVEAELADKIISSDDTVKMNTTSSTPINVVSTDRAYVRGGTWKDKNWHQILEERGLDDMIIIKNGFDPNGEYCRVALFRYDLSGLKAEDIGYATMFASFSDIQPDIAVEFDFYLVDNNWDEKTVTMNTLPKKLLEEPVIEGCVFNGAEKSDVSNGLKMLVAGGNTNVTLMMVQTTNTNNESRIGFAKATDLSFPYFTVFKNAEAGNQAYVTQLVDDEAENQAIWDHAKKVYDEWYARYEKLKSTPLADAELIVSDQSQYSKTSTSPGSNPKGTWKTYSTRTYGDLADMSKYVDVTAEPKFDKYGGIMDDAMRQEATGFFYSTKINGRWWIIDPLGYPCYIRALSGVVYSYQNSPKQKEAAYEKYGSLDKWAIAATRHLMDDLHFNACASPSSQIRTVVDGMIWQGGPSVSVSAYGSSVGVNNSNGGSTTFSENNTMPVFDPEFETFIEGRAAEYVPAYA